VTRRDERGPATDQPRGRVIVTGAAGLLGSRVCAIAAADPEVSGVVALDLRTPDAVADGVEVRCLDLATDDLKAWFEGAGSVLHLLEVPELDDQPAPGLGDAAITRRVLDAAGSASVPHVVLLSSAAVYGAWSNNPVPLTEEAPLRPNPGARVAAQKAEIERMAADWRDEHPGSTVTVLRPTLVVAEGRSGWLARVLRRSSAVPVAQDEPPAQYVDIDDLATAVDLARRSRLDGPYNVAPDGWIPGPTLRALAGGTPRLRLPGGLAARLVSLTWRWGLGPTPPELLPYAVHPWVVANDRLRAAGWAPLHTSEEAYVAAHRPRPWTALSPRRRQELILGGSAATLAGVAVAGAVALRRRRR
jgi:nucleoside-diphosphate-sugar epimerase